MLITTLGYINRLDFSEKFGNFTKYHHTFGKNTETYNAATGTYKDFEVITLQRKDSDDVAITTRLTDDKITYINNVINWLFNECKDGALTINEITVESLLTTTFQTDNFKLSVDSMVVDADNNILPNSITFIYTDSEDTESITLWFNSLNFETDYPSSDVIVFGQTETVDLLINDKATVLELISSEDINSYNTIVNDINRENPYTGLSTLYVTWINKDNTSETMDLRFNFICYGPVMNDETVLKTALRKYIESNTEYLDVIWEKSLPEIFTATIYMMIPAWDSISNGVGVSPIYNPIVNCNNLNNIFLNRFTGYTITFLEENFEMLPCIWQSLTIGVSGSPNNKTGYTKLSPNLNDYMLVSTTSVDFIRLAAATQDFILKLSNCLPLAEVYTTSTKLSTGITMEIIEGQSFLVFSSYGIKCKILIKSSYLSLSGV